MAIRYEDMPQENQQRAIDIFARQQRGEITQAEAERQARANETDAQNRRNQGARGGSFLVSSPSGGGGSTSGGGGGSSGSSSSSSGSVCGPKPTESPGEGYRWRCDSASKRWVRVKVGGENTSGYRPGQNVGGPDRVTEDGGAVVDGIYIPPGTFGGGRPSFEADQPDGGGGAGGGTTPPGEEEVTDPMTDPTRMPDDAPEGYQYEWNGSRWVLVRIAGMTDELALRQAQESAMDLIARRLEAYGLGSLSNFIWKLITEENITSEYALIERIRETDQYKQRFPAMRLRRDANLAAISEQEYINLESGYREVMQIAGLPRNMFDTPEDFTSLIAGDVSVREVGARIQQGYQAVAQSNPQVIREMKRLYGVDDGMLAAYFLDPERATPMLLRQAQAAQIAGEASLQIGAEIGAATAEELAVAGVTQEEARQGFQTIGAAQELFVPLPGTTEEAITTEEQVAGIFGTSGAAQQRIRQRQRQRQAAFEAGGRFAGQGTTVTGLQ